ncbi:MAG: hypothetical protein ACEPOZ_17315 [Marinifilaceae bacterium]
MKIYRTIFFLAVAYLLQACAGPSILQSNWKPKTRNADQLYNETPASFLFSRDDISLKVFNNREKINLILESNTPITVEKILRLGLSIWIDPSGKNNRNLGVNFPLPFEDQAKLSDRLPGYALTPDHLNAVFQNLNEIELVNFIPDETLTISRIETEEGVSVQLLSLPNKLFRYNLSILLNKLYPQMDELKAGTKLSIGISSVNEPDSEYYSAMSSREVIRKKMDQLKAGNVSTKEITEQWMTFELATP